MLGVWGKLEFLLVAVLSCLSEVLIVSFVSAVEGHSVVSFSAFWVTVAALGATVLTAWGGYGKNSDTGLSLKRVGPLPAVKVIIFILHNLLYFYTLFNYIYHTIMYSIYSYMSLFMYMYVYVYTVNNYIQCLHIHTYHMYVCSFLVWQGVSQTQTARLMISKRKLRKTRKQYDSIKVVLGRQAICIYAQM